MITDQVVNIIVKGKDKLSPTLQKAGGSLVSLGQGIDKVTPKIEKAGRVVGTVSRIVAIFSSVLPPAAGSAAAFGKVVESVSGIAANAGDAWSHMLTEVGQTMESQGNIIKSWANSLKVYFQKLLGLGDVPDTLAGKFVYLGRIISNASKFLSTWGYIIDKVRSATWVLVSHADRLAKSLEWLRKIAFGNVKAATSFSEVMVRLEQRTTKVQKVARWLFRALYEVHDAFMGLITQLVNFMSWMNKILPTTSKLVLKLTVWGKVLTAIGVAIHKTAQRLAFLKKIINPHLAESFQRISDSLKEMATTMRQKVEKAVTRLGEGLATLRDKASKAIDTFKGKVSDLRDKVSASFDAMKEKIKGWVEGIQTNLIALGKAFAFVAVSAIALGPLFKKIGEKFETFMPAAAKLQGINDAFLSIAKEGAPAMYDALKKSSAGMVEWTDLAGRYVDATLLINKQVADQLPEALTYLTKISLATGEDMGYLLDSLVRGVGRLSPKILDNMKIQISLAEATDYATVMFGKEADQLSITEKQVAIMSLAMDKLRTKTAGMADATGTLTQLMAEHKVIQAENAQLLAGIFIPVAKSFYKLQIQLALAFRKNISEGGKYYNTLRKLSAGVSVVIDLFTELVDKFTGVGAEAVNTFADKMFDAAWNALEWGANIVNNIAIGMTRAAATVLRTAMNFIGNILAYWLAPGSPPLVAPMLGEWGAGAFTEWLMGFTEADYGVLTGVQAPLRSALQNLVSLGDLGKEEANELFLSLSKAMSQAVATGDLTAALEGLAGVEQYGAELEDLFRHQMAVAEATQAVEEAEARLVAARDLEEVTTKRLSKEAREYNRLLKEGASDEVLRAKLAQMKATYNTLEGAREEAELAEAEKKSAQEHLKEQSKLMRLQNSLLQQLIEMGQVWASIETPDEEWDIELPELGPIFEGVDEAFEALKDSIRGKFVALWEDLKEDWATSGVGMLLDNLRTRWEESNLKLWLEEFIFDVREQGLVAALGNLWTDKISPTIQAWLDDKYTWLGDVWRAFTEEGIKDGTGAVSFKAAGIKLWIKTAAFIADWLGDDTPLSRIWKAFTEGGVEDGSGRVDFGAAFTTLWSEIKTGITTLSGQAGAWFATKIWDKLAGNEQGTSFWGNLGRSFIAGISAGIASKLDSINWYDVGGHIRNKIIEGFRGIADGIKGALNDVINVLEWTINRAIQGLNFLIQGINAIPGTWVNYLDYVQLPRLAQGGMVKGGEQLALLHGPEIVLPLNSSYTQQALAEAMTLAQAQVGAQEVVIHNHFGQGSVRSRRDITDIATAIQKSMELQGVRSRIA